MPPPTERSRQAALSCPEFALGGIVTTLPDGKATVFAYWIPANSEDLSSRHGFIDDRDVGASTLVTRTGRFDRE